MTVGSQRDIHALKNIGRIVALTLREMKKQARVGMTAKELDDIGGTVLARFGAFSAPRKHLNFPGHSCISLNRAIAHGIPDDRPFQAGDLINIDVCAEKNGYIADTGSSFQLPPYTPAISRLCRHTYSTMMRTINSLKDGVRINEIGRRMEAGAKRGGYAIVTNLHSHGVGRAIHEQPDIAPYYDKHDHRTLKEGMVITIEPFLSTGATQAIGHPDGWTLCMPDESFAAQYEHTIIITKNAPIIITVA